MPPQPQINTDKEKDDELLRQTLLIVENSFDAIIGESFDGTITSWNGGATRMFGYTAKEMVGKSVLIMLPPETKDEISQQLDRIKKGEVIADFDTIRLRKDGTRINVGVSMSPVKTGDGKLIGASIVERDITIRKRSEESMRQIQLVVDNSYDALIGTTLGGIVTSWSGGATRMFGYTALEMMDRSLAILNPPELKDEVKFLLDKVATGNPVVDYDSIRIKKDGTKIDVSFSTAAIQTKDGIPIGVSTVIRDSTNRKKREESIRQIQLVVDNSVDAIIGENLDGTITSWNGGATRMFGYTLNEMVGKSASVLIPKEIKDELPKLMEQTKDGKVIADHDSIRIRKDKTNIDIAVSISPIKTEDGKVTGASVVYRDITQRKKEEDHVKELNNIRSKFIEIMAHQLRTPIGAINWNLESILNGDFGKLEDVQYKFLQATHESSTKLTRRIGELLTAMDIEEGRITFQKEDVAIDNIAGTIIEGAITKCKLKNITCEYVPPSNKLPVIKGDSEKIRIVITGMIDNAMIYTKDGGKIIAKLDTVEDSIRFQITDNGIGIPEPEKHRVFTRFFRASNASIMQPDSFGLGLFTAKNFITGQGGTIGFESMEGKGSTFWFTIPLDNHVTDL